MRNSIRLVVPIDVASNLRLGGRATVYFDLDARRGGGGGAEHVVVHGEIAGISAIGDTGVEAEHVVSEAGLNRAHVDAVFENPARVE